MRKLLILAFALLMSPSLWATTYCVDQTLGSDAAAGTATGALCTGTVSAWKTLAKVNGFSFVAGDTILLKRGEVWREQLTNPSSGTSGNVITFGAYGSGAKPQINAAGIVNGAWTTNTATYDFTFDADAGSPGNFTSKTDSGGFLTVVSNPANTGTSSYQLAPPSSANHYIEKTGLSYTSSLYSAFYVRFGSGFNWNEFQLFQARIAGDYFIDVDGNTNNGFPALVFIHNKPTNVNDLTNFPLTFNTWYLIEVTCTGIGTSSGVYTGYINGQKVFQTTGINWSAGYTITTERLGMVNQYGAATTGNLYLDNGWTHSSTTAGAPNTWKATLTTQPKVVLFDGSHGVSRDTQGALVSTGDWTWSANTLYAYGTVAPSTSYSTIQGGVRDFAVLNDGKSWVTYDNLDLRNANQFAMRVQNSSHITLQNSLVTQSALGGTNVNNGGGQTSSFLTYSGNEVSNNGGTGIEANCGACGAITVDQVSITNNYVHDNGWNPDNTTGYIWTTAGIKVFGTQTTHVSISNNLVTGQIYPYLYPSSAGDVISGSGIWLDTIGSNAIAQYNVSHDNQGYGAVVEFTDVSPAPVLSYNVAYNNYGGIGTNRASHNVLIYNNSAFGNTFCGLCNEGVGAQTGQVGNQFKNNVSSGNLYNLVAQLGGDNAGGGSGNVYDHNNFGVAATNFIQWGAGVFKSTYAALDTAYGSSTNSIQGNPLFASSSDLSLRAGSPAIDTGLNLGTTYQLGLDPSTTAPSFTTVNQNSFGAWDLGAFVSLNIAPGGSATDVRYGSTLPPIAKVNSIFIINDGSGVIYTCAHAPTCTTASQWKTAVSGPAPVLSVSTTPGDIAFGTVQTSTPSDPRNVAISNTGSQLVTIGTVLLSGTGAARFSTSTICAGEIIDPGATCVEQVIFNPTSAVTSTATVTVTSNAPIDPLGPLTVALSGTGTATATFPLSVNCAGTGSGTITSNETPTPLINAICTSGAVSGAFTNNYASGATPILTFTPASGSVQGAISGGGCSASGCTVTVTAATTVSGTFTLTPINFNLTIAGTGAGIGTITSNVGGINCNLSAGVKTGTCVASYAQGTVVTLTETPSTSCTGGSCTFGGWTGVNNCTVASTCPVTVDMATTVSVDFAQPAAGSPLSLIQTIAGGTPGTGSGPAFVKACHGSVASDSASITVPCNIGAGNAAFMFVYGFKNDSFTWIISDSAGQSWGKTTSGYAGNTGDFYRVALSYKANSAALTSITASFSDVVGGSGAQAIVMEFSGMAASNLEDSSVDASSTSSTTTPTSGTLTTTGGSDVLIFCDGDDRAASGFTAGAGYTIPTNGTQSDELACQYKIVATVQTGVTTSMTTGVAGHPVNIFAAFNGSGASTTVTGNWASAQNAGDFILCGGQWSDNTSTVSTLADTSGNTYTQFAASPKTISGLSLVLYHADSIAAAAAGANTTTLTLSASPTTKKLVCLEYSGGPSSPVDSSAGATGTGTAINSGNVTSSQASDLLVGFDAVAGTLNANSSGYTQRISTSLGDVEDKLAGAATTYNFAPTQNSASNWAAIVAAIKTSGAVNPPISISLSGSGTGSGTVTGGGFNCNINAGAPSGVCSMPVTSGSTIPLAANPAAGSAFGTYSGLGCSTSPSCTTAPITVSTTVNVSFSLSGTLAYFVNGSTGNDANSGLCAVAGTPAGCSGPWATITKAGNAGGATLGASGTTIFVAPGNYGQTGTATSGTASRKLTYQGAANFGSVVSTSSGASWANTGANVTIRGFKITGIGNACIGLITYATALIEGNWVQDIPAPTATCGNGTGGAGIDTYQSVNSLTTGNIGTVINGNIIDNTGQGATLSCNNQHGLYIASPLARATNNLVSRSCGMGVHIFHFTTQEVLSNNVIINNAEGGIQNTADSAVTCNDSTSVFNNIVANNGGLNGGLSAGGITELSGCTGASNTYRNNWVFGNSPNALQFPHGARTNTGNIMTGSTATAFTSYTGNAKTSNLQSPTGSPAINGGISTNCAPGGQVPCVPTVDFLGIVRPQGTAIDIGAYEK